VPRRYADLFIEIPEHRFRVDTSSSEIRARAHKIARGSSGTATLIATGGMGQRGADAVVMVEHTETGDGEDSTLIEVRSAPSP
jgi:molybdopterin biosynthesis enzyme